MRMTFVKALLISSVLYSADAFAMQAPKDNTRVEKTTIAATFISQRPTIDKRLFVSKSVEKEIVKIEKLLKNPKLKWMFENCFPNTIDTTVHFTKDENGKPDTFVYTGDIHAMWLRDSAAQVWPYIQLCKNDKELREMIAGVINRQIKCILIDPYANAFNNGPKENNHWASDKTKMTPLLHERKWEIDSLCYPIRLAYEYWKVTGDASIFDENWQKAMEMVLETFIDQQMKTKIDTYSFQRETTAQLDTRCNNGLGAPVKPVGLIASAFRPSDDATTFSFLVPSNFFAVTSLNKAAEILRKINSNDALATRCETLAKEVSRALEKYAVVNHPKYGNIYAFEVDGFGNKLMMDDANVPSLLAMAYLGDIDINNQTYQNTRNFVWSEDNPYFFKGTAAEGIGGPHVGYDMIWPMSIMMKAFTSQSAREKKKCIEMLLNTDNNTGFIHESFNKNDPSKFTRKWFAWQNTLFGELIIKMVKDGDLDILNSVIVK